jgi:hypothetical protein
MAASTGKLGNSRSGCGRVATALLGFIRQLATSQESTFSRVHGDFCRKTCISMARVVMRWSALFTPGGASE